MRGHTVERLTELVASSPDWFVGLMGIVAVVGLVAGLVLVGLDHRDLE